MKSLITFLLFCCFLCTLNAQFTATMVNTVQGIEKRSTIYSDLVQYRFEFIEDDMEGAVIIKPDEDKTFIMMPEKKYVYSTTCNSSVTRMNDPWQAYLWYKSYGEEKSEGEEKVSGCHCKVLTVYQNDNKVYTCYFADKLKYPVKLVNHFDETTHMHLENIKPWKVEPSKFIVPADYIEVDRRMQPIDKQE